MTVGRRLRFVPLEVAPFDPPTPKTLSQNQTWSRSMNRCRDMAIWNFPRWRPILDCVQPTYKTTHDGALSVLSVLSNFVLIWLVSKILKIQVFLRLAWNCLTTPTVWGFYRFWYPDNFFSHRNPQKGFQLEIKRFDFWDVSRILLAIP